MNVRMFWLGADDPEEIAIYRLVNGQVELKLLKEDARFVAEEPMVNGLPSSDMGRRLFPKDGRAFLDGLIDQGRRLSYYDYLVEPDPETAEKFINRKSREWSRDLDRNRAIRMKDIGRAGWHYWVREAWTFLVQSNQPEKVLVVERIRHTHRVGEQAVSGGAVAGDIEYRFGYYLVRRIRKANGTWGWGQYSPMIPQGDLRRLLEKATAEGTIPTEVLGGESSVGTPGET